MTRPRPILHGRDHLPGGADPIPGGRGILFDTYNVGDWLSVEATDVEPLSGLNAIQLSTGPYPDGGRIQLESAGAHAFLTLAGAVGGGALGVAELSSEDETSIVSGDKIILSAGGPIVVPGLRTTAPSDPTELWDDSGVVCIGPGGVPASGGGPGVKLFDSAVSGADAVSIDTGAGGIPGGYTALDIFAFLRCDGAANIRQVFLQFNGDTGTHYDWQDTRGTTNTPAASSLANDNGLQMTVIAGSTTSTHFTLYRLLVMLYADTVQHKVVTWTGGYEGLAANGAGSWKSAAAINQLTFRPQSGLIKFKVGSRVIVYGVA